MTHIYFDEVANYPGQMLIDTIAKITVYVCFYQFHLYGYSASKFWGMLSDILFSVCSDGVSPLGASEELTQQYQSLVQVVEIEICVLYFVFM